MLIQERVLPWWPLDESRLSAHLVPCPESHVLEFVSRDIEHSTQFVNCGETRRHLTRFNPRQHRLLDIDHLDKFILPEVLGSPQFGN